MDNTDEERKQHLQKMSDFYADDSNTAMNLCNDTTRNLNGLLMTASLAYIGVVAAVMDIDVLQMLSCVTKMFIILGIICFGLSIVFGILESIVEIRVFREMAPKYMEIANMLAKAIYDDKEYEKADEQIKKLSEVTDKEYGRVWLYLQIGSFGFGAIFTLLYIVGIIL